MAPKNHIESMMASYCVSGNYRGTEINASYSLRVRYSMVSRSSNMMMTARRNSLRRLNQQQLRSSYQMRPEDLTMAGSPWGCSRVFCPVRQEGSVGQKGAEGETDGADEG